MTASDIVIRPARTDEYDEIARVWMESWVSTGLDISSASLLEKLRARIPREIERGWSLFVAEENGTLAAMLAINLPDEVWLRCVRENEKAWRWYEREGFVFEREALEPAIGMMMKYYRSMKAT